MRGRPRRTAVRHFVAAVAAAVAVVVPASASATIALPAKVVPITPAVTTASYPTVDYGTSGKATDDKTGTTTWRVVNGTGNCCENYVTISRAGTLYDFGGRYLNYSADRGQTWYSVQPQEPLVNGEGAVVMAPNGDVVGVEWDPYSGDHLLAFKQDAATGQWLYNEMPLHQPFYDREWIAVAPGPFTIDGQTYPYLSFIKGGVPKEFWFYSTDGVTYTQVTSKFVDETLNGTPPQALAITTSSEADWIQPNTSGAMTPLGGGDLLAAGDLQDSWSLLDGESRTWRPVTLAGGSAPDGLYQVDSAGRLHNVIPRGDRFTYGWSSDNGATWHSIDVPLPANSSIKQIDFRANRDAGVAAVAVHAHDSTTGADRDLVYKLGIKQAEPKLLRQYTVGLGDVDSTSGVGNDLRFDFETVAIFPDGRVAVSFFDSTTHYASPTTGADSQRPALAIEGGTKITGPAGGPPEPTVVGTAQAPITTTVVVPVAGAGNRVCGVTSGCVEFDVPATADDASMQVKATPATPADIDLYLQRQLADGTWSSDLASGTSGSLTGETMNAGRLLAGGHYRLEAHLWVGLPATQVALQATFFNSAGVAGT